jgi:DNA-binding beta-propeller fold protein YncE
MGRRDARSHARGKVATPSALAEGFGADVRKAQARSARIREVGECVVAAALTVFGAAALAACGGSSSRLPPAAEPARSPPLDADPAGQVVPLGHKPEGLAFDPVTGLLAVGLTNPDRLALVDGESGRTLRRIRLPESPRHLRLAAPGGPVLVPAEGANAIVEVSLPGGRLRTTRVGSSPHDAARARGRLFVGDELGHTLSVVERGRRIETLPAPRQPGGVAATANRRHVGVVGVRERALELFDTRTLESAGKVSVGIGPTHLVGAGERFFVVDTRGGALLEVRLAPLRVHRRTHLGGTPYGIALDTERRRYWVTLTASNRVAELTDHRVLRRFPTVRQPNSVAFDPRSGRVFVASRKDGTLQFFDPSPCRGDECGR